MSPSCLGSLSLVVEGEFGFGAAGGVAAGTLVSLSQPGGVFPQHPVPRGPGDGRGELTAGLGGLCSNQDSNSSSTVMVTCLVAIVVTILLTVCAATTA